MPLYEISAENIEQIRSSKFESEKELQTLFEENLVTFLGVRFIATEFSTGDRQRGRVDTLGLDEDGSPTIIEYKITSKENVINQGLFYLDWLVDHKGDFALVAQEILGSNVEINWSAPRLIIIAESFTEYDKYAVNRIGANIELWTFRRYGKDLMYLEPLFTPESYSKRPQRKKSSEEEKSEIKDIPIYTLEHHTKNKPKEVIYLFETLQTRILDLAEEGEIIEKANKMYIGYKHGKNFCEIRIQTSGLKIWLDLPKSELDDPYQFTRDVSKIGHYGTGATELKMSKLDELEKVISLVEQSFFRTI